MNNNSFIQIPQFVSLIVEVIGNNGCRSSDTIKIFACCKPKNNNAIVINNTSVSALGISSITAANEIMINGEFTIDQNFSFQNCYDINFGPLAKINVLNGFKLEVYGCILHAGCEYMWDGIYVTEPKSQVDIIWCEGVYDAINAVLSKNGGIFHSSLQTHFINNYIGIDVMNYFSPDPDSPSDPHPGTIFNTEFTNDNSAGNFTLRLEPYANKKSFSGVRSSCVEGLIIGDPNEEVNNFSNLDYGIYSVNSIVEGYNNFFKNINSNIHGRRPPTEAAIFAINEKNSSQVELPYIPKLKVGGTGYQINNFQDCYEGVFNYNQKADIIGNIFSNCNYAIQCLDIVSTTNISNNTILGLSTSTISGIGIEVSNIIPKPVGDNIYINSNFIENIKTGIWARNIKGKILENPNQFKVYLNQINFIDPLSPYIPSTLNRTGIFMENCDYSNTYNNYIYKNRQATENELFINKGIRVASSKSAYIWYNNISNTGAGIYTNGDLLNTQFACNSLNHCYNGFYFGEFTGLSDQGIPPVPWEGVNNHNKFTLDYGLLHERFKSCQGCIVNGSTNLPNWFYFDNKGPEYTLDIYQSNPDNFVFGKVIPIINNSALEFCNYPDPPHEDIMDTTQRAQMFDKLVNNQDIYIFLNDQYMAYNREYFFQTVKIDSNMLNLGSSIDLLYNSLFNKLKYSNPGILFDVENAISKANFEYALTRNDELNVQNIWDLNRKQANLAYLKYFPNGQFDLDSLTFDELQGMAYMTPYYGGNAVYTARVMLRLYPEDEFVAYNSPITAPIKQDINFKIYPNPAQNQVIIEKNYDFDDQIVLTLYDILGQQIKSTSLNKEPLTYFSTGSLQSGVYVLKFTNPKLKTQSLRLIINK